jgi:hypothetical protein
MQKRAIASDDLGTLFLMGALIFGAWFRILPPLAAGFPINDGGLFYANIQSLRDNRYLLPTHVQYNGIAIPFAYPPFAFYLAGSITDLLHGELIGTLQWLPAIVLILTIPAIYVLASLLLKSKLRAGIAIILYALMPRSITWLIMGGGITRSLGQLFIVLSAIQFYRLYTEKQGKHLPLAITVSALACLSHPEAAIHTIAIAVIFWLQYGRNMAGIRNSLLVAAGTLLVTSPWWLTILLRFGLAPFQSASQTSFHNLTNFFLPIISFSEESFLPLIGPLAILGIGATLARREYLLPALYLVPLYVEPRFALNVSIIPMALLASVALCDIILPALSTLESRMRLIEYTRPLQSRAEQFILVFAAICLLLGMQVAGNGYSENRVSPATRQTYEWVKAHTPADGKFMILTGITSVLDDPINEWFPALAERQSITTAQGTEWLGGDLFANKLPIIRSLQQCRTDIDPLKCADEIAARVKLEYDYIIFTVSSDQAAAPTDPPHEEKRGFRIIYASDEALILEKIPALEELKEVDVNTLSPMEASKELLERQRKFTKG